MNQEEQGRLDSFLASICRELEQVISPEAVIRWFHPLRLESYANQVLTLHHDQSIYRYWIEENYLHLLTATASNVLGEPITIVFQLDGGMVHESAKKVEEAPVMDNSPREPPLNLPAIFHANLLAKPAPQLAHLILQS